MPATLPGFLDSRDFGRIAAAIAFIDAHYREQPRLARIAAVAGLSEFHFNRLFRRWAGVTPKQYLSFVTGREAARALDREPSVLEAALSVGLSGPGRLHDLIVALDAVTPGELKGRGAGLEIRHGVSTTPFGTALLAATPRGLCHLAFVEEGGLGAGIESLRAAWPGARFTRDDREAGELAGSIWTATAPARGARGARGAGGAPGERRNRLRLAVRGTNFQLKVWRALLELDGASTTTYARVAGAIGMPGASRAVGNAVGANPVAWLIPCHRVLRSGGALGGYHWGVGRKRAMLALESLNTGLRSPG